MAGLTLGGETSNNAVQRVKLDLVDGSSIIGITEIESLPIETPYSKMDIPLSQILRIRVKADKKSATFDLTNGDKLNGTINIEPLKLAMLFGQISVNFELIRELRTLAPSVVPVEGLIAWYRFEDGNTNDSSDHHNHCIVRNAKPSPDRNKRANQAILFDGKNAWIEIPAHEIYDTLSEISVALWMCPVANPYQQRASYALIGKQPSGSLCTQHGPTTSNHGGLFDIGINVNDGLWRIYFSSQVSTSMCTEGYNAHMQPLPMGQWYHLVIMASRSENRVKIYVDGKKVDDAILSNQIRVGRILSQPNNEPLRIGKRKDSDFSGLFFSGSMDEIIIYNRTLDDQEIAQIYESR